MNIDSVRKNFRWAAGALTIISAIMTFMFGIHFGTDPRLQWALGLGLPIAAFVSAYAWPFVLAELKKNGGKITASVAGMMAFAALGTGTDVTSNFGSLTWQRVASATSAEVQNVRYDDVRTSLSENVSLRKSFVARKAKMQSEAPWAASVTADGLRKQVEGLHVARESEAKLGGCGRICRRIEDKITKVQGKIAAAEKMENYDKRIAAIDRVLAELRTKSASTAKPVSAVKQQNISLASMFTLSLEPGKEAQHWTDKGVAWLVAAFFTFAAMGCNFVGFGGLSFNPDNSNTGARSLPSKANITNSSGAPVSQSVASEGNTAVYYIDERSVKEKIKQALAPRYGNQVAA